MPTPANRKNAIELRDKIYPKIQAALPEEARSSCSKGTCIFDAFTYIQFGTDANQMVLLQIWLETETEGRSWTLNLPVWLAQKVGLEYCSVFDGFADVSVEDMSEEAIVELFKRIAKEYLA